MRKSGNRDARGFSLAEVLVAIALLSVILLALFGLVTAGVRRAYGGKKMTEGSSLAESVMERVNVPAPHELFDVAGTATTATRTWHKTQPNPGSASVAEAVETTGAHSAERNAWRALLANSTLPTADGASADLTVTLTPLPEAASPARTFATSAAIRIVVEVSWSEYGTRRRNVRLQTLNVRSANL